jgi:hypothetical protein
MGVYTSVIHPNTGQELQFKTGDDFCGTFMVGDELTNMDVSDGIYETSGSDDYFVVIKRNIIMSVVKIGHMTCKKWLLSELKRLYDME